MRTPQEAIADILAHIEPLTDTERVPLAEARGRVLARAVTSDVDLPPFEKAMMDGIALRAEDAAEGPWDLELVGESRAGVAFDGQLGPGQVIRIYTGAELCAGADAVEMVEKVREEDGRVHGSGAIAAGQHVSHRAEILEVGRTVLSAGRRVDAVDLTLLAAVGADPVEVVRRPRITVLTTGDELVPPSAKPGPAQIREGNTIFLSAAAAADSPGALLLEVGIVPDDPAELEARFARALDEGDVLVTTGGVSMGKYDLVGDCLEKVGVEPILHKVAIKPGKPIWFGKRGDKPVFGLPGNPSAVLVCYLMLVLPALRRCCGAENVLPEPFRLPADFSVKKAGKRQEYLRVRCVPKNGNLVLEKHPNQSSGMLSSAVWADGLAVVPVNEAVFPGDVLDYFSFADLL